MDGKMELLICLGAATASNCVPCFEYYFKRASEAGLDADEVMKAVELANKVKIGGGIFMRKSIREITGFDGESRRQADDTADHPCCDDPDRT
ncbi:MAG: carboxymuconolactone decarboxylase family protein [Acidobacteriota bacterium]